MAETEEGGSADVENQAPQRSGTPTDSSDTFDGSSLSLIIGGIAAGVAVVVAVAATAVVLLRKRKKRSE